MARGGKREGAGRKRQGITKKVSLTLTPDEWAEIEASGLTVAAFLKMKMHTEDVHRNSKSLPEESKVNSVHFLRRHVEELWDMHLRDVKDDLPEQAVLEEAKTSLLSGIFRGGSEHVTVRTHLQYECPFTGKRFGSMDRLVRAAIPHLIRSVVHERQRKAEREMIRQRNTDPKYFMDLR